MTGSYYSNISFHLTIFYSLAGRRWWSWEYECVNSISIPSTIFTVATNRCTASLFRNYPEHIFNSQLQKSYFPSVPSRFINLRHIVPWASSIPPFKKPLQHSRSFPLPTITTISDFGKFVTTWASPLFPRFNYDKPQRAILVLPRVLTFTSPLTDLLVME